MTSHSTNSQALPHQHFLKSRST